MSQTYFIANPVLLGQKLIYLYENRKSRTNETNVFYSLIVNFFESNQKSVIHLINTLNKWGDIDDYFLMLEAAYINNCVSLVEVILQKLSYLFNEQLLIYRLIEKGNSSIQLSELCHVIPNENSRINKIFGFVNSFVAHIYGNNNKSTFELFKKDLKKLKAQKKVKIYNYISNEIDTINIDKMSDTAIINNYNLLKEYTCISESLKIRLNNIWTVKSNFEKVMYISNNSSDTYLDNMISNIFIQSLVTEFNSIKYACCDKFVNTICIIDMSSVTEKIMLNHIINVILTIYYSTLSEIYIIENGNCVNIINDMPKTSIENQNIREQINYLAKMKINYVQTIDLLKLSSTINNEKNKKIIFISAAKLSGDTILPNNNFLYWKISNTKYETYWKNNIAGVSLPYVPIKYKKNIFESIIHKINIFKKNMIFVPNKTNTVVGKTIEILSDMDNNMHAKLNELTSEVESLKNKLDSKTLSMNSMSKIISDQNNTIIELTEIKNAMPKVTKMLEKAKISIEELMNDQSNANNKISNFEKLNSKIKKEYSELNDRNEKLMSKYSSLTYISELQNKTLIELNCVAKKSNIIINNTTNELKKAKLTIEELISDQICSNNKISGLEKSNIELLNNCSDLTKRNEKISSEYSTLLHISELQNETIMKLEYTIKEANILIDNKNNKYHDELNNTKNIIINTLIEKRNMSLFKILIVLNFIFLSIYSALKQ